MFRTLLLALTFATALPATAPAAGGGRESISLDGEWLIAFDYKDEGRASKWHELARFEALKDRKKITVPSCWETIEKDYEGAAYYRRVFRVPAGWADKAVRLQFDAVNFIAEVWLNGVAVGTHEGGFTPFEFRIDDQLKFDADNTLILRVAGPILMQNKRVDGIGQLETTQWRGAITGGIWQPVRLIATGEILVKDVFIEPRISDNTATFHLELAHEGTKATAADVGIVIRPNKQPDQIAAAMSKTLELKPGRNQQSWTLQIPDAAYWSPDQPNLYRVEVSVALGAGASDLWTTRFGMREFTIRDKKFLLNGKPLYLKATFFEGLYPVKLAYPDSREMAVREIQLAKEAGFNMIRPWRKPPPPMWLDLAEEMGVLTVGSLAVECMDFPVDSPRLAGWVENEVRQSILRDRNRTSVVQWELFNEIKRPAEHRLLQPMSRLARELDPTRLILDESGGWAQGANIYLPYESEPIKFNDIHDYPGPHVNEEVYQKLLLAGIKTHEEMRAMGLGGRMPGKNVVPGLMSYFSELGYGSLPDLVDNNRRFAEIGNPITPPSRYHNRLADEHKRALKESGFDRIYPDLRQFLLDQQKIHGIANQRMIEAVRCNPTVQGYCIHALTDGDWIIGAGLLDLFRNPKPYVYEGTKAASRPRILSIRVRPRNVYAERGAKIEITGVNETEAVGGSLKLEIGSVDGAVVFTKTLKARMDAGITPLFSEALDTKVLSGKHTVKASVVADDGSPISENTYSFDVFGASSLAVPEKRIAVIDPSDSLKPFLRQAGIPFVEFDAAADRSLPVFVSRTEARTPEQRRRFAELSKFVQAGGTAVYLQGGGPNAQFGVGGKASPLLPVSAILKQAVGTWAGVSHLVKDHPVFEGLPVNGMMGAVYENVWAPNTMANVGGETIAASIGYDWFPGYELFKRHYIGPGDTWWGADVAIVPHGTGRCLISQLRLLENLGKDPVADKILFNLIRFAAQSR